MKEEGESKRARVGGREGRGVKKKEGRTLGGVCSSTRESVCVCFDGKNWLIRCCLKEAMAQKNESGQGRQVIKQECNQ